MPPMPTNNEKLSQTRKPFSCHDNVLQKAENIEMIGRTLPRIETVEEKRKFRPPLEKQLPRIIDGNLEPNVVANNVSPTSTATFGKHNRASSAVDTTELKKVACKPIVEFLRLVDEYPLEYSMISRPKSTSRHPKPVESLMNLARIFHKGHHDKIDNSRESNILKAAYELKPKPPLKRIPHRRFSKIDRSSSFIGYHREDSFTKNLREEEGKTEFEICKMRLDRWLRTVSTFQFLKARKDALSELGEEDIHAKWWVSLQSCRYLRHRHLSIDE